MSIFRGPEPLSPAERAFLERTVDWSDPDDIWFCTIVEDRVAEQLQARGFVFETLDEDGEEVWEITRAGRKALRVST